MIMSLVCERLALFLWLWPRSALWFPPPDTYRVHEDVNIRTAELAIENMLFLPQVECGTRTYDVEIVDTAGQDEFADFRNTALAQGDAFLVLFAINSPYSWGEVKQLRERIVLEHEDKDELPMVIVGNKKACVPVSLLLRYSFDIYFYVSGSWPTQTGSFWRCSLVLPVYWMSIYWNLR